MALDKREKKKLLKALEEISGKVFTEGDVVREGSKIVVPTRMSLERAAKHLLELGEAEEQVVSTTRRFKALPYDGALAVVRAIEKLTGTKGIQKGIQTFFGNMPPQVVSIPTGPNETTEVPWGDIHVDLFEGVVSIGAGGDADYGVVSIIAVEHPKRLRGAVEGFFQLIEQELEERSIYRGKAFDARDTGAPEFIDTARVHPGEVVYSQTTFKALEANLWGVIANADKMREAGLPLKRAVLLYGPYGTGKTLAGVLTAQVAEANGWTYILVRPGEDSVGYALKMARLYSPAVVFVEDVDTIASADADEDRTSQVLDMFDGFSAKGEDVILVLTSNHPENIHPGMVRPGRLDALIEVGRFDVDALQRLVDRLIPDHARVGEFDYDALYEAAEGYTPAFLREGVDRARRYAIATRGEVVGISHDDLLGALRELRPQFELMNRDRNTETPDLEAVMATVLREAMPRRFVYDGSQDAYVLEG